MSVELLPPAESYPGHQELREAADRLYHNAELCQLDPDFPEGVTVVRDDERVMFTRARSALSPQTGEPSLYTRLTIWYGENGDHILVYRTQEPKEDSVARIIRTDITYPLDANEIPSKMRWEGTLAIRDFKFKLDANKNSDPEPTPLTQSNGVELVCKNLLTTVQMLSGQGEETKQPVVQPKGLGRFFHILPGMRRS